MTRPQGAFESEDSATVDAHRLYWCVAELPSTRHVRPGPVAPGLIPSLEDELPIAIDDVHAVCTPIDGRRVAICACPRSVLAELKPALLTLTPSSIPESLGISANLAELNLLVGAFEPAQLRAARGRRQALALGSLCAVLLLVVVGVFRRADHAAQREAAAKSSIASILSERTFDGRDRSLLDMRDELRSARDLISKTPASFDSASVLQDFIRVWPTSAPGKVQSLVVAPDAVSIGVVIDGGADPAKLLSMLHAPAGYALEEPRLNASGQTTRIALIFRPTARSRGATP